MCNFYRLLAPFFVVGLICMSVQKVKAQEAFEDIVYLTCAEAHDIAEEDTDHILAIVKTLAGFLIEKRELTVPENSEDRSAAFGQMIKAYCTVNPDRLLFDAVDRSLRRFL